MIRTVTIVAFTLIAAQTNAIVIDDYTTPISDGGLEIRNNVLGQANVLNDTADDGFVGGALGERSWTLEWVSGNGTAQLFSRLDGSGMNVVIDISNSSGLSSGASVSYALTGTDKDLEFTGGPSDRFELTVIDFNNPGGTTPVAWSIQVFDGDSNDTVTSSFNSNGIQSIPHSAFTGIDFTDVSSVHLGFGTAGAAGADFAFDNFVVVPEPSTFAALAGLLALGLVAARRRPL